ncbi:S9 family peptidase [Aquabacterium humicola]|uniref:S9 family peptidase n=1 Tax=Aquabacterium humicola TaxID=3237377 RepID=UPI00254270DA|nr:prolyl oligopeptidase family serine peptidase [Rubrivivax pictus]
MNKTMRRASAALLAILCTAGVTWAQEQAQAPAPVPIPAFFSTPKMSNPVLSPDGKRAAVLVGNESTGHNDLVVLELGTSIKGAVAARYDDADVIDVKWVNDERLVYSLTNSRETWYFNPCPGLWAVNHDGSNMKRLVKNDCRIGGVVLAPTVAQARELPPNHLLLRVLRDGSPDVVIQRFNYDAQWREVQDTTPLRLNTVTGLTRPAAEPGYPANPQRWVVDQNGSPRLLFAREGGNTVMHWRADDQAPWQRIGSFDTYRGGAGGFRPLTIGPDGELYATATRSDAARTTALYRFDRQALKLESEPVVGVAGFDFAGAPIFDHRRRKLIGVRITGDATGIVWLDDDTKKLQARIDQLVPGHVNLLHVPECGCSRWVVVQAYSDRQPSVYLLYDRETDKLERLGTALPDIDARRMAERDFVRITSRDGLSIPVHVTKPAGKGPWPTVVLVHGGPWVRGGDWQWTAESQFLASRGYLVIEPEFRGSEGYGQRHFEAGLKQWGLKMQDDVADAARWAVDKKLADAKRMCIAGASYGGYSTLMGLVRDPDLYRCGVAWVAVTDIDLMYDISWSDLPEHWKRYGMPALIGDQVKDAAQLEATSPLKQAHRIKQPLLLAFGSADRRVPVAHGTKFRDAVKKTNEQVEWIEYANEGHGFIKPENRYDFYSRMEKFLATHLQAK